MKSNKALEQKIDKLADIVYKVANQPVAPVAPVAPVLPIAPIAPVFQQNSGDHDLLLAFRAESLVEFKTIKEALSKLQEATSVYITRSEFQEVVRIQTDHESRTRLLETATTKIVTWGAAVLLIVSIAQFIIGKYF
jgi:hypothetical protein